MSVEFRGYSLKTPEQLHNQVQAAQYTGDIQLVPPTIQDDEVAYQSLLNTPKDELAERYALRMSVYSDLLRRQHSGEEMTEEMQRQFRRISALNNMDTYIAHHNDEETASTLRGRQATVFEDIRNHLEKGKTKGYVTLPTGSGKTVLFTEVVEAMGLRTLIVVPTLPILDQTKAKFEQFAQGVEVGKVYGKEKDANKQVTVITHDSLRIQTDNGTINPQEYDVIIVDEAHENLSPQRRKLLAEFDHAVQLGFTATPEYQEGKPEKHIRSVFEEEIHSMSIREAIKEDMLCGFTIMNVRTHVDISNVQIKNGNYSPEQIEKAVNIHRRNNAPLTIYQEAFNGQSAIAFCASITHAEDVAQLFTEAGIPAAAIHSQLDRNARRDLLAKYESGEIKVLMGVDILTRGFDAPNAQVCFNLVPTLSKVVALQRAGRVLRIDENNPDKVATIVEFDDDDSRGLQFGNLIEPGESHAELLSDNLTEGQRQHIERTRRQLETIDIEGMEVHYELERVMELLSRNTDETVSTLPEGYVQIDVNLWAEEYACKTSTVIKRVRRIIKGGSTNIIITKGLIFCNTEGEIEIRESLQNVRKYPEDRIPLLMSDLVREFGLSQFRLAEDLKNFFPLIADEISQTGLNSSIIYSTTTNGLRLIKEYLSNTRGRESHYYEISLWEIMNKYHLGVIEAEALLREFVQDYPELSECIGSGITARFYCNSTHKDLFSIWIEEREQSQEDDREPRRFMPLVLSTIGYEFRVSPPALRKIVSMLTEAYPDEFIEKGSNIRRRVYATSRAFELMRNELQKRDIVTPE